MKFNIKSKFSVKTIMLLLLGLFLIFIFVYNLGNTIEGMESSRDTKSKKKVIEAAEGDSDSTENKPKEDKPKEDSKVDKETLKFIVDKMLK